VTGPRWPDWPTERGWIGLGTFVLTVMVLWMLKEDADLMKSEFFKTIATAIVLTGFVNGPVSWAYSATKGGGELADNNAHIVREKALSTEPQPVTVEQPASEPIPVKIPESTFAQLGEDDRPKE
jgi:hypothetical protein